MFTSRFHKLLNLERLRFYLVNTLIAYVYQTFSQVAKSCTAYRLSGKHLDSLCLPDREPIFHLVNTLKRKLLKPVYHLFTSGFERLPDKIVRLNLVTLIRLGYSIEVESERNRC